MKTVIFDLDGTILDTLKDLAEAVNYALRLFSLPEKDLEFVRKAIGNGTQVLIKRCTPDSVSSEKREKVFVEFKNYYLEHYDVYTKPYVGIKKLLIDFHDKCQFGVVSNKDNDLVHRIINKEFPNLFSIIQGSYFDKPKKPDPYLINKVIKENNINKKDVLYVGDTDIDEQSALNAGIDYRLVNYGYRNKDELKKTCQETKSFSNVEELYSYIGMWVNL